MADGGLPETTLKVTQGAVRLLESLDMACVLELRLANGRRGDVVGIGPDGMIWIVEVKSCRSDYESDLKWPEYRPFCDRLLFAVDDCFPQDLIPKDVGLIIADQFGGAIIRPAPEHKMAAARRKAMTLRLARHAARRAMSVSL